MNQLIKNSAGMEFLLSASLNNPLSKVLHLHDEEEKLNCKINIKKLSVRCARRVENLI